jgi:hypothetical protein
MFAAIRRASSRESNLAADLHANVFGMAFANLICIKPILFRHAADELDQATMTKDEEVDSAA